MPREVLSQEEIDLLLRAMASGEMQTDNTVLRDQARVRIYDFRRPNKFSKEQLRTLYMIHDNFNRLASNFLSGYLRSSVRIKIVSVDQVTYEDFMVSIPNPTLLTVFSMHPLRGTAILETNPAFVFPIIDLLLGGNGYMPPKVRELTDIEMRVLRRVNGYLLEQLCLAWGDLVKIEPQIDSLETNPQFNQIISPNETVAVISFTSTIGETPGLLNLCLPFATLETVADKLTARNWFATQEVEDQEASRKNISALLGRAPVEMAVLGGKAAITLREFLELQPGDVITLGQSVKEDIQLLVGNKRYLYGQLGVVGNRFALLLTSWAGEGGKDLEQ